VTGAPDSVEFVLFETGGEVYGVETGRVDTVVEADDTTRVPMADDAVEGVTEVRGEVTAVVDVATVLGDDGEPRTAELNLPPGVAGDAVGEATARSTGPDQLLVFDRGNRQPTGVRVPAVAAVETFALDRLHRDPGADRLPTGVDPALVAAVVDREGESPVYVLDVESVSALAR
jgi:purine-binding chemotaxis protein CheW